MDYEDPRIDLPLPPEDEGNQPKKPSAAKTALRPPKADARISARKPPAEEEKAAKPPHRFWSPRRVLFGMTMLVTALVGATLGLLFVYSTDLPQVGQLETYHPSSVTQLYDVKGRSIGSFALQRRILIGYDEIPKVLYDAVTSIEDKDFDRHWGIDFTRIFGAAYRDIASGSRAQGASTLTMQLARNLFLNPDRKFSRKVQEIMLSIQIERRFTKPQIFTMYANQIYLGSGVYGFEAGAQYYFGKHCKDLTLEEAALLAGLPKAPSQYSPVINMDKALRRRNLVINNMLEDGKITAEQAQRAKNTPIHLVAQSEPNSVAPYFIEELRRYLEKKYGSEQVHAGGLRVYTTLDLDLQKVANKAVLDGVARYERRHGWKGSLPNVIAAGDTLEQYSHGDWNQPLEPGAYQHALVTAVDKSSATVRMGRVTGTLPAAEIAWTEHKSPLEILSIGDIAYVRILSVDAKENKAQVALEQDSGTQAALVAIDNATGGVKAMVGGRDFEESKFNRATQALRQTGSSFKPYVYAAAVDAAGVLPDDTISDTPISFPGASGVWAPHNYDGKFEGTISIRHALADSRNVPAVRLAQRVGIHTVVDYVHKFGITSDIPAFLPIALGSAEVSLIEHTGGYSTFPNDGVRVTPRFLTKVVDFDGHVLEEDYPEVHDVVPPRTARIMTELLQGVVKNGTGYAATKLNHPVGGKTGTTNDFTDAWFMGFTPSVTCGVWIGFDEKKTLGKKETGAQAALPIWMDFMRAVIAVSDPNEQFTPPSAEDLQKPTDGGREAKPQPSATAPPPDGEDH
jgi:penicillin-binding protein 1A